MDHSVILSAIVGGERILLPIEKYLRCLPRIGETIDLGEGLAIVQMVTHFANDGFYYPGTVMRRNGIKSNWGVSHYFRTVIDVELRNTHYKEDTAEMWNSQQGWDFAKWIDDAS